jgi:hypothetical protein
MERALVMAIWEYAAANGIVIATRGRVVPGEFGAEPDKAYLLLP